MFFGSETQRKHRVHSEEAIEAKFTTQEFEIYSRYFLRVTALCRATEVLLNDAENVDEVSEKLLEINEAFIASKGPTTTTSLP